MWKCRISGTHVQSLLARAAAFLSKPHIVSVPTREVRNSPVLPLSANIICYCLCKMLPVLWGETWFLDVLKCIPLILSEVDMFSFVSFMVSQVFPVSELLLFPCLICGARSLRIVSSVCMMLPPLFGHLWVLQDLPPMETVFVCLSSSPLGLSHLLQGGIHSPS